MIETLMYIFDICMLSYLGIGLGFYIVPHEQGGYSACGFEEYNLWFIPFWLPALFSENVMRFIKIWKNW